MILPSPELQDFLMMLGKVNNGLILGLKIKNGELCMSPRPRLVYEHRSKPPSKHACNSSRSQAISLFFARLKNVEEAVIDIEVSGGSPHSFSLVGRHHRN